MANMCIWDSGVIIGLGIGSEPNKGPVVVWSNPDLLLTEPLRPMFSEI